MKTILCFGDSNTYGSPGRPLEIKSIRHRHEDRWTSVLQHQLGAGFHVIPEGLPGRTTVHDDPVEGAHKNGRRALLACLESHAPVDAVVLMLGTNDLKARFGLSAWDIAQGAGALLKIIRNFSAEQGPIKILLICPPPILEVGGFAAMFKGGAEKSQAMPAALLDVAALHGAAFLDAGKWVKSSLGDGIHLDKPEHLQLGNIVATSLLTLLN